MSNKCPVCVSPVRIVSDKEGTCYYERIKPNPELVHDLEKLARSLTNRGMIYYARVVSKTIEFMEQIID